jgi:hypothetical protein
MVSDAEGVWYVRAMFETMSKAEIAVEFFGGGYPW